MIRRLDAMIGPVDLEGLNDREAVDLFRDVDTLLRSSDPNPGPAPLQ